MRIITVEEHFEHPQVSARAAELGGWTGAGPQRLLPRTDVITPSGMYSQNQLNYMTAELGADRIVYSEDFPYIVRDDVSTFLERAGLSEDDTHAIAHANAEALLRI